MNEENVYDDGFEYYDNVEQDYPGYEESDYFAYDLLYDEEGQ
jgi:hypothetical protein